MREYVIDITVKVFANDKSEAWEIVNAAAQTMDTNPEALLEVLEVSEAETM